ncbi:hypothetical protein [Chitinophaga caeni]|uniref:hypothetical protein n=1 Tax=Chitinophaga caeni TaxID=2029983 RepID=UPI0012FE2912|nr:hypothetical protein [Chitinophaga caeni]
MSKFLEDFEVLNDLVKKWYHNFFHPDFGEISKFLEDFEALNDLVKNHGSSKNFGGSRK